MDSKSWFCWFPHKTIFDEWPRFSSQLIMNSLISSCHWARVASWPNSTKGFFCALLLSTFTPKRRQWLNLIVYFHWYVLEANPIQFPLHLKPQIFGRVAIDFVTIWNSNSCRELILLLSLGWRVVIIEPRNDLSIDFISRCWWLNVHLTWCSLELCFMFATVAMSSWTPTHLCILPTHTNLTRSVLPTLIVLPPVFREHIITYSIMSFIPRPAHYQSLCHMMC